MTNIMTEDEKELDNLESRAIDRYMENSDFNALDWIPEKDAERYKELFRKVNGFCCVCGDTCTRFDQCSCTKGETA